MKFYHWLKYCLYTAILIAGILFEQAPQNRLVSLIALGASFLLVQFLKDRFWIKRRYGAYTYLLDLGLIYGLETFSKFTMNYFIQIFYLILMIEIAWIVRKKEWFFLCLATLFVSAIKVTILIQSEGALGSFVQLGFFLVVSIMLLFILQIFHRYRDEKDAKEALYKELFDTHRKLKDSTERLQEFSVVKERQRIARELHDALGHDLTALIYRLEVVQRMDRSEQNERDLLVEQITEDSRMALRRVREVVETLREERMHDSFDELKVLVDRFIVQTKLPVIMTIDPQLKELNQGVESTLYRLVQEGLTNVMRHANAHRVEIVIVLAEKRIEVFFRDDGSGATDFKPGFGLKGMRERIEALGGNIAFMTDHGFVIKASLPLGGSHD